MIIDSDVPTPEHAVTAVLTGAEVFIPLAGLIKIDEEIARLQKEYAKLTDEVTRVEKKLANSGFVAKAPAAVIESERQKGRDYRDKRDAVAARIEELKQLNEQA